MLKRPPILPFAFYFASLFLGKKKNQPDFICKLLPFYNYIFLIFKDKNLQNLFLKKFKNFFIFTENKPIFAHFFKEKFA